MPKDDPSRTAGFSTASRSQADLPNRPRRKRRIALTVISHPDPERVGDRVVLGELDRGQDVRLSRHQPAFERPGPSHGVGRPLEDRWLSRQPVILRSIEIDGAPHIVVSSEETRTVLRLDGQPWCEQPRIPRSTLAKGVVLGLAERIVLLLHETTPWASRDLPADHGLVGWSDAMVRVRQAIDRVAALDIPVLIRGSTGTGKELVASALHHSSQRASGPFVSVNLGALPPSLASAELFGAVKGAFTGADRSRPGYFGQAQGGTLFLDEIAEAPPEVQVMLLRALESGEIYPVGSSQPQKLDLRILAATDADLDQQIAAGAFRAPLLHRLASYEIHLPRLIERRDDLGRLLKLFLDRELRALGEPPLTASDAGELWIRTELVERLLAAPWPGNIRQLRNIARTLILHRSDDGPFENGPHLGLGDQGPAPPPPVERPEPPSAPHPPPGRRKPSQIDDEEIRHALRDQRWSIQAAAQQLGIPRTSLASRLAQIADIRTVATLDPEEIRTSFECTGGDLEAMVDLLEVSEHGLRQRLRALGLSANRGPGKGQG